MSTSIEYSLAGSVLANVENMRAAAAEIAPQEFEGGPTQPGGAEVDPPVTLDSRGAPERNGNLVDGNPGEGARPELSGVVKEPSPNERPAPKLIMSNRCLDTAKPAVKARSPRAAVSRHLVLIGGTDHARSFSRTG